MRMWVQSLASLSGLRIRCCCDICGAGHRCSLDPMLLWLWHGPEDAAPIQPLAWELPHAADAAIKSKKKSIDLRIYFWLNLAFYRFYSFLFLLYF